jgi:hypothetical protein
MIIIFTTRSSGWCGLGFSLTSIWCILDNRATQHKIIGSHRMFRSFKQCPEQHAAIDRVKEWTRERFKLADDAVILVSEIACALPGCPPLETVVAFWTEGDRRHQFKLFKSVADVVPDDLPPAWMKRALMATDGIDCECC